MRRKTKIGITVIIVLALCFVIPYSLVSALWIEDVPAFQTVPPLEAVDKVRKAEKQGGTVELNEAEANSIIALFTQKQDAIPYVQEVHMKLGDNSIELYAQESITRELSFFSIPGEN